MQPRHDPGAATAGPPLDLLAAELDRLHSTHLVHVDGTDGSVLAALLRARPGTTGVLVADRRGTDVGLLDAAEIADRVDVTLDTGGALPPGGDVYLVVDPRGRGLDGGVHLLSRCRGAMAASAHLLVVEPAVATEPDRRGLREVLRRAGFTDATVAVTDTDPAWAVASARPA